MAENTKLSDEMMEQASGGAGRVPDEFLGDGTIMSDKLGNAKANGIPYVCCQVQADSGETYSCIWGESNPPVTGLRVKIIHLGGTSSDWFSGMYEARRI